MAKILCIDTSGPRGVVLVAQDGQCRARQVSDAQQQHASFLHPATEAVLATAGLSLHQIDAIAVSNGPGSYTGLRISLAAAKGFCYALNIPLIALSSLEILARASKTADENKTLTTGSDFLYCPMIDARRMEVFTAVYDEKMQMVEAPHAAILNEHFLESYKGKRFVFSGNGMNKWKLLNPTSNDLFVNIANGDDTMGRMAEQAYGAQRFADVAYAEPFYCKAFYTTAKVVKGN